MKTTRPSEMSSHASPFAAPRRVGKRTLFGILCATICLLLASCKPSKPEPTPQPKTIAKPTTAVEDQLTVFAAASLRTAFTAMGDDFKLRHLGVTLTFNFAGTQELRTQLEQGADADVFASADQKHLAELRQNGKVLESVRFARNEPVLLVAKESADRVKTLADLPSVKRIIIGVPEVPIGRYTLQILDRASKTLGADFRQRVEAKIVSRELNVRQVFAKVNLGEADAGIVYRTDAQGADASVKVVTLPAEVNVIADYPIAVVASSKHPTLAKAWVSYVVSAEGQKTLEKVGFLSPKGDRLSP